MAPVGLWVGVLALAAAAAGALLLERRRDRAVAMALSLLFAMSLVAADNWDTARFEDLRAEPALAIGAVLVLAGIVAALGFVFVRYPWAFALTAVAALPFRVPVDLGGETANLLVPLYVVLAGGIAAVAYLGLRGEPPPDGRRSGRFALWAKRLLAAVVVLYALQAGYSDDFSNALETMAFFLAPFAVLFALLLETRWTPAILRAALAILVVEGLVFSFVGFGQYATRELFWNEKVIAGNEVHSWFRVNSLFWDPNILGRYLAVTIIGLAAVVAWARKPATALIATALAAVLLAALAITFSQSSMVALIAGLAVVAALRWSIKWTAIAVAGLALVAVLAVLAGASGTDFGSDSIEAETSGRAGLISGGLDLAEEQPLAGQGSGAFERAFRDRFGGGAGVSVVSHTEPVTVAAEQGAVGLVVYLAFLAVMSAALLARLARLVPGFGGRPKQTGLGMSGDGWTEGSSWALGGARAAVVAAFAALIVHSFAYAAFFTDPIMWTVVAVGLALAREPVPPAAPASRGSDPDPMPAQAPV